MSQATPSPSTPHTDTLPFPLWRYPFRPFFLLTALYAIATVAAWLGTVVFGWPVHGALSPMHWHSHEMLFGMVPAAIAGFLLTAMCNWTGARPLAGAGLVALVLLWLAGRVVMWTSGWWPPVLIAVVDSAFLLAMTLYAGAVLARAGNSRNLRLVAVLGLLTLANVMSHLGYWWLDPSWAWSGERLALFLIVLLVAIIGGRITPFFTANWLAFRGGDQTRVRIRPAVNILALLSTALLIPLAAWPATPPAWLAGAALIAGLANGVRLLGWQGWRGWSEPLIWVLHLGYAWLVAGLLLMGVSHWLPGVPSTAWIHVIAVGAMGTMIIGVMTRVALGHTGRPLALPRGAAAMYVLMTAAVILRLAVALDWIDRTYGLMLSGAAWILTFALFLYWYTPILIRPRADGRPG